MTQPFEQDGEMKLHAKRALAALLVAGMTASGAHAGRLLTTPDFTTFEPTRNDGTQVITNSATLPDGGFVVTGNFSTAYEGQTFARIMRFKANGEPDTSWKVEVPGLRICDVAATPVGVLLCLEFVGVNNINYKQQMYVSYDGNVILAPSADSVRAKQLIRFGRHQTGDTFIRGMVDGRVVRFDINTGIVVDSAPFIPYGRSEFSEDASFDAAGGVWQVNCDRYVSPTKTACAAERYVFPADFRVGDATILRPAVSLLSDTYAPEKLVHSASHTYWGKIRLSSDAQIDPAWRPATLIGSVDDRFAYTNDGSSALIRVPLSGTGTVDATWRWTAPSVGATKYDWASNLDAVLAIRSLTLPVASGEQLPLVTLPTGVVPGDSLPRYAIADADTASVPPDLNVVEYYLPQLKRYFITGRKNEQDLLDAMPQSFQRTGMTFAAKSSRYRDIPEQPVCRLYFPPANGGSNTHFYGVGGDCGQLNKLGGMKYEGFDFSVLKPAGGSCPATAPNAVTRLYNNKAATNESNHRYVVSAATKARMLALGWIDEGPVFCIASVTDAAN